MNKLALDIGGNGVQYSINDNENQEFSTVGKDKKFVLEMMAKLINENNIKKACISSPCAVNTETGYLLGISGIKNYGNFNLYNELKELLNHSVELIAHNDANAAFIGNLIGENYKNAIQVTLGTGIGGSVLIDGNIFSGPKGMAGEFGYPPFEGDLNTSRCCSANALVNIINNDLNTEFNNYLEAKTSGIDISLPVRKWTKNVAKLLINLYFSFDPEAIFISGGIIKDTRLMELISKTIKSTMRNFDYDFEIKVIFKDIPNAAIKGMKSLF